MATFQINDEEWYAMSGLSHLAREVYFVLRRYMDYSTGITGLKRKVSLKAITEELYIEPHQGIKEEQPSERQIRRALDWLEKVGLIDRDKTKNRANKQSIFKLLLATRDCSAQNKAVSKWSKPEQSNNNELSQFENSKVDNTNIEKAVMPPISDIYNNNYNARVRDLFSMHEDWLPDKKIISMAKRAGITIPVNGLSSNILGEFINYWLTRPEVERTQDQWQHALINSIKKREAQNASTSNYKQSRSKLDCIKTQPKNSSSTDEFNGFINRIFSAIAVNYPAWAEKYLADDKKRLITKRMWHYALKDLSNNHVSNGIERMLNECEFPPVPATFRKLCFTVKGVPDLSRAFTEALSGNYSCKLVRRAAELTGIFDLRRGVETDTGLRKRYEYNHTQLVNKLIRGESIDEPVTKAIENTQQIASFGVCDDLIEKEIQRLGSSEKSHYEQFRALIRKGG